MTQSGKSFLKEEEQKKNIASNMIGSPTAQREAFEQLKNAQDIKKADKQLVETPEGKRELNLIYQEGQQEPIKVDLTKGGVLDEEGYTVSQQNGLTVKTKMGKVNKAQEKVAEKPQLEEEKKALEDITAETELDEGSRLKRATDTFMNKYAPKVFKAGEYLPFVGPMFQLSENMSQKWVNAKEDEVFLSNGKEITSVPKIQDPDLLVDMKDLTKNILLEYGVNGNVVTAQQIKEAYPQYKNISDQVLDNFIGGAIGAYVNGQEIDRDIVGKNYSTMSIMEGYTGERQQELDLITNQDLRKYMSVDLQRQIVKDPEALKLIEAYDTVKFYVDMINTQGYNYTDASDRKIANTYRNQALQFEGIMSLDEAMSTIENYDPKRLSTLMGALQKSYETGIKGEIDKVTLAENHEKLYNAIQEGHAVVQFVDESFDEATDQFLEYVAEQNELEPTALKRTPASWMGDLATKFISGNMRVDNDGNYRNIQGEVVFHRNPDGSYVDKKGRTVQEITGLQRGWIRNEVNALTSVLEGVTKTVEGGAMRVETGDRQYSIQALAGVTSSVVNATMLAKGQGFFALSSTPGLGRGVDAVFQESMEMGGNVVLAMFDIAQLTNTWTDESKESLKELGGLITVAGMSRLLGKSESYKNIKKAVEKVRKKHADTYLQVIETSELKDNIKNPKGTKALEDKTGVKEVVDTEGKTIGEIKEELIGEKTEPGKEVKETKTEEKATVKGEKAEEKTTTKEREVVDVTPTLQKIGQSLSINKIVAQRMREDFKNEVSKLNKESESKQALYDVLSSNPKFDGIKNAIFGTPGKIFDATIDAGISILQTVAKAVANAVTGKTGDKKLLRKAYKKMNLAESVVKTIENNPKISQLGKIFHELIGEKGEWKQNIKNIEKYVKERVAEMWEEEARNIQKALEKAKDMAHEFYGNLTTDKKIRFGKFFTGENGIKTVIESRLAPYVKIMEIDGKIYVQIIPGASGYNKIVASLIKRFAKEYNELVEDGRISEKDIESLGDILRKRGNSKDMTVANTGRHLKQALQNYLSKTGEANEWLKAEKAYDAIHSLYKMFNGLYKDTKGGRGKDIDQKVSADKIVKFLEGLSEEQLNMLEEYLSGTKDTIDLLQNGATAVKEFADRYRKGKEIETFMGQKGKGGMNMRGKAIIINLVDLASWMHNSTLGMAVTGITLGGLLLKGGMTATGRINNILKNKKLRKLLQTALDGDPEAQKQLSEHTEAIQQGVKMVNDAIEEVIEKRTRTPPPDEPPIPPTRPTRTPRRPERNQGQQGPNRKEYDTSVPNREEYDPNAPIFRNGEERQQPSEQRDNDMVVSEQERLPGEPTKGLPEEQQKRLTDERQYLGYEEDPEAKLEQAMADLEVYIKDALETLKDLIDKDDTDDGGDGGDGGNGPTKPTKPTKPTDPDTKEAIDTIDDWLDSLGDRAKPTEDDLSDPKFNEMPNEEFDMIVKYVSNGGKLPEEWQKMYEEELQNRVLQEELDTNDYYQAVKNLHEKVESRQNKVADHKAKDYDKDEFSVEDVQGKADLNADQQYDIVEGAEKGKYKKYAEKYFTKWQKERARKILKKLGILKTDEVKVKPSHTNKIEEIKKVSPKRQKTVFSEKISKIAEKIGKSKTKNSKARQNSRTKRYQDIEDVKKELLNLGMDKDVIELIIAKGELKGMQKGYANPETIEESGLEKKIADIEAEIYSKEITLEETDLEALKQLDIDMAKEIEDALYKEYIEEENIDEDVREEELAYKSPEWYAEKNKISEENEEKPQVQPSDKEKSEAKEIETEEVSEGEEGIVFEDMPLRELLTSEDPEAQDEVRIRKQELANNPKKLYQEMKQALKDKDLTSEEKAFYTTAVEKARSETDMSEKHEDMLLKLKEQMLNKINLNFFKNIEEEKTTLSRMGAPLFYPEGGKIDNYPINLKKELVKMAMTDINKFRQIYGNLDGADYIERIARAYKIFKILPTEEQEKTKSIFKDDNMRNMIMEGDKDYRENIKRYESFLTDYLGGYMKDKNYKSEYTGKPISRVVEYKDIFQSELIASPIKELVFDEEIKNIEKDFKKIGEVLDINIPEIIGDKGVINYVTTRDLQYTEDGKITKLLGVYDTDSGNITYKKEPHYGLSVLVHELAHNYTEKISSDGGLDFVQDIGIKSYNEVPENMEDYYSMPTEIISRAIQMFYTEKTDKDLFKKLTNEGGFWKEKTYYKQIKPVVEKYLSELREKYGRNKQNIEYGEIEEVFEELIKQGYYDIPENI